MWRIKLFGTVRGVTPPSSHKLESRPSKSTPAVDYLGLLQFSTNIKLLLNRFKRKQPSKRQDYEARDVQIDYSRTQFYSTQQTQYPYSKKTIPTKLNKVF
jgi:hypothetical protein